MGLKYFKGSKLILSLFTFSLAIVSCQKDSFNDSGAERQDAKMLRTSGVIEDNPLAVAKVPVIVSSDFLNKSAKDPFAVAILAKKPSGTSTDRTAPAISITSPANGASVAGTISIIVNASDNIAVASVSFSVDGLAAGSTTVSPFTNTWNSASVVNGTHTLMVTAMDAAGNSKSASIQVSVNNVSSADVTNPTVSITSPSSGASVTGTVNVAATASDNVGVSAVEFSIDGKLLGTIKSAPYAMAWNTSGVANGFHTITATATDAAGNVSANSIQVNVNTTVLEPTPLPSNFILSTPTPANQGNEGSCVAFAVAYAARSIEQFYASNATSYSVGTNIFSPEYVYNQTKFSDCSSGTAFTTVLDLIKSQGVATWQSMPYSDINGCSVMPDANQMANASAFKISSYSTIPNTDRTAIKSMIASKHPVIINVIADNSFINAGPGFIWKAYSGSGALPHAIIICGYDDAKNAYKIMNSWGTGWGDGGFSWIDYDFFTQKSSYNTYVIQ